jgi:hypothetical protein
MKKITVTLDEKTAAWARIYAAQVGKTISRLLGEILREHMREMRYYNDAMRHYLSKKPLKFQWADGRRPTRDELHERPNLR